MSYDSLRERVFDEPIVASDGNHSLRLWRVAENVRDHARRDACDDRLLHLMARIGGLCRSLSADLRSGHTSPAEVAILLDQLADLGDLSFEQWRQHS
jgi:hypothetical protein